MRNHIVTGVISISSVVSLLSVAPILGQTPAARPQFEVASVKPNNSGCPNGRGGGGPPSPGRLTVNCIAVRDLIQAAYGTFANGSDRGSTLIQVLGAPAWVDSDPFDITAKADNATVELMYGPMLQMLLEDRFRLKIHHATRELPVYSLTLAKGGLKMRSTKPESCTPVDLNHTSPRSPTDRPPVNLCGRASYGRKGPNKTVDAWGVTMARFAGVTLSRLDLERSVVDKTGLAGLFDVHMEFAPDIGAGNPSGDAPPGSGPSIFTAMQEQLGLKLSPDKAPVEVLVVDHIEKPSGN
ncbi:MAG TPA: TIGR03435 family protein [Bryobacteraceae bacterium]|nr:TIGR03435 family protein [Bryobacteraceae bacterium]